MQPLPSNGTYQPPIWSEVLVGFAVPNIAGDHFGWIKSFPVSGLTPPAQMMHCSLVSLDRRPTFTIFLKLL